MSDSALGPRLSSVARRMRNDFDASRQTHHKGSRGTEREEIFKNFLDLYVPRRMEVVHNSEIITAAGEPSPQCDIAIIDEATPRLQDLQSHRIIPAECVYGVAEVKSRLTGPELRTACDNVRAIKRLARTAYTRDPQFWIVIDKKAYEIAPIFGWIFAYDSINLVSLGDRLAQWCTENEADTHPDGVWVLGQGMFIWSDTTTGQLLGRAVESRQRTLHLLTPINSDELLFSLVIFISKLMTNVRLPPLMFGDYVHGDAGMLHQRQWVIESPAEQPSSQVSELSIISRNQRGLS
jgi:hypothetical protein